MSLFELLPNETLEYLFSFTLTSHFPLRQTCKLLRENIPPLTSYDFKDRAYEAGDIDLIKHYKLPCSVHNLETILRKGHEGLFGMQEDLLTGLLNADQDRVASACVQGRSRYIIDYLFRQGHVKRNSLVLEACRQNYLELVKEMYSKMDDYSHPSNDREGMSMHECVLAAVSEEALDVLAWLVEKDNTCYSTILHKAAYRHRTKVLRWLPQEHVRMMTRRYLFLCACSAPNMDMFNFLLEMDYLAKQGPKVSTVLARSPHVEMLRTLVLSKGWILSEEMFETALEWSCQDMLSCLLELHCPHDQNLLTLLHMAKHDNLAWLIKNLSFTEETLLHVCMHGESENLLVQLIRQGCLPESFKRFYIERSSI
nr:hypothetical protein Cbor_2 [Cedratvirus borely]